MTRKLSCPITEKDCNELLIRPLQDVDVNDIMVMLSKSFPHNFNRQKTFWKHIVTKHDTHVLEKDEKIIGILNLRDTRPRNWIDLFAIDHELQGKGYGTIMLQATENIERSNGTKSIHLHTEQKIPQNVAFYSKNGYKVTDFERWGYSDGHKISLAKLI